MRRTGTILSLDRVTPSRQRARCRTRRAVAAIGWLGAFLPGLLAAIPEAAAQSCANSSFAPATNFSASGPGTTPVVVAIGDFNADGKPDLVSANLFSNSVSVPLNATRFDPTKAIQRLIDRVNGLGNGNSLTASLQAATKSLSKGNTSAACGQLQAFIGKVNTQIGPPQQQQLIGAADSIRRDMGCR